MPNTGIDAAAVRARLQQRLATLTAQLLAEQAGRSEPLEADAAEQAISLEGEEVAADLGNVHERALAQVVAALARLDAGSYGICARCGRPVAPARLVVMPEATLCVACV